MQAASDEAAAGRRNRDELPGLSRACQVLAAGGAVVVPNPAPMSYGIVATSAETVNVTKRRPVDQNVAVSLHNRCEWQRVAPSIDLPAAPLDDVPALLSRRLSLLLPLRSQVPYPRWVTPAVRDGYLAAFNGHWAATARLWERFPRLYGSSANITGEPPATTAAEAVAMFGGAVAVIDGGSLRGRGGAGMASTMVRVDRTGRLRLYRAGAQDADHLIGPSDYGRLE